MYIRYYIDTMFHVEHSAFEYRHQNNRRGAPLLALFEKGPAERPTPFDLKLCDPWPDLPHYPVNHRSHPMPRAETHIDATGPSRIG